ncbi:MAG: N-acetyltransferase family protein [Pseudomonadota bacterium]
MIRPATEQDAAAICALWNPLITDGTATFARTPRTTAEVAALIAQRKADGHAFLVACDGPLLGYAGYAQFRGGDGYATCMEHSINLAPAAQGKGVGRLLMTAIEDHARARGAHQMIAGVSGENAAGQAFHARLGYAPVATIPQAGHKFGRYIDLVLMQKFL